MKRVFTGAVIALVAVLAFLLRFVNIYIFDILIGVATVFATLEISKLLKIANRRNLIIPALIFPSIAYIMLIVGINLGWGISKLLVGIVLLIAIAFIIMFVVMSCMWNRMTAEKKIAEFNGSTLKYVISICMDTLFNFIYPVVFLLMFVPLNHIAEFSTELTGIVSFTSADLGLILLLLLVLTTIGTDIFALYVGTIFKGKKLAPRISPNKTISGAIGGIIGAVIFACIGFLIFNSQPEIANGFIQNGITIWLVIVYSVCASVVCQIGDLFESYLKRKAGTKDSGKLLPGHGGLMDRFDSISFNAMFTLVFFVLLLI